MIDDGALLDANDFGAKQESLFDVVGHGDDGEAELCGVLLHAGEQGVAQVAIDTRKGLVEQEETGCWNCEGAGEIDALALAAGEVSGYAMGQLAEFEEIDCCGDAVVVGDVACLRCEGDVFPDGEMGE